MKKLISLFTALCIVFGVLGTFTVFAEDSAADLEISTLAQLEAFRDDVNNGNTYEGKTVKLTADIDMSEKYGGGKERWTPIGYNDNAPDFFRALCPFAGVFDGTGHKITNLYIVNEGWGASGLFGENTGTIENLAVNGTTIYNQFSGGIVGHNLGTVRNCCFSGEILGVEHIGGIVGLNIGTISDCFNVATITSNEGYCIAGIVGLAAGMIERCYNIGNISADGSFAGIAVGEDMTLSDCYYLLGTADKGTEPDVFNATALTAEQFADKTNFTNWDFDTVWKMDATLGRPVLRSNKETADEVIEISTLAQLEAFRDDVNSGNTYATKTVKLTADIDMSEKYGEGKESWTPIDTFAGTFDGGNHTISGFYAYPDEEYSQASFFGNVNGTIENLNVKGIVISNNLFDCATAGIVVWLNENAQMLNCSFEGVVKGFNASGLVSVNFGFISGCKFNGKVEGTHLVGGIASNNYETIMNCINEGEIIGSSPVGGIVGAGTGTIKNCINKGSVTGKTRVNTYTDYENGEEITESIASMEVGGIVGDIGSGVIENCYNTGAVSGNSEVGGIIGVSPFYYGELDNIVLSQVKNCYNIGNITSTMEQEEGEHNVGSIIGSREFNYTEDGENFTKVLTSEAVNCYYLVGTADKGCGGNAEDTATALTTEQFADKTNFTNWDFDTVWKMDATLGRPVLRSGTEEPPIEHTHTLVHHAAVAATCTETGTGEYWKCEGTDACNKMFSDENGLAEITEIPTTAAAGHSYGAWSIITAPKFTETGIAERICTENENHKDTFILPILTNNTVWTKGLKIEPTETENGLIIYTSQYGTVTVIVPPLNPNYDYSIKYENGKAVVTVPQDGIYTVIFASYDNGILLSMSAQDIQITRGENSPISPQNFNANGKVKVMLWDSLMGMKPLAKTEMQ